MEIIKENTNNCIEDFKGFKIIPLDKELLRLIIPYILISPNIFCDYCNKKHFAEDVKEGELYYIAVLNQIFCKECLQKFLFKYSPNKADKVIEDKNYNLWQEAINFLKLIKNTK